MKQDDAPRIVSLQELSELLGVSRRAIHNWRKQGLPTWREGGYRFIDANSFIEWFESRPPHPAANKVKGRISKRIRELRERGEL